MLLQPFSPNICLIQLFPHWGSSRETSIQVLLLQITPSLGFPEPRVLPGEAALMMFCQWTHVFVCQLYDVIGMGSVVHATVTTTFHWVAGPNGWNRCGTWWTQMAGASEMTCFFVQGGVLLLHAVAKGHRVIRHILVWRRCNVKTYSFGDHFKVKR